MKKITLLFATIIFSVACAPKLLAQIDKGDSLALVDIYNITDGANWTTNTNWLTKKPVSTWYGVTTAGSRVKILDLGKNSACYRRMCFIRYAWLVQQLFKRRYTGCYWQLFAFKNFEFR